MLAALRVGFVRIIISTAIAALPGDLPTVRIPLSINDYLAANTRRQQHPTANNRDGGIGAHKLDCPSIEMYRFDWAHGRCSITSTGGHAQPSVLCGYEYVCGFIRHAHEVGVVWPPREAH